MTPEEYLQRAEEYEAEGKPTLAALYRDEAARLTSQPPPGPRADESPFIGQRTSEIGTVASEPPQPAKPSVSLGSADAEEVLLTPDLHDPVILPTPTEPQIAEPGAARAYVEPKRWEPGFQVAPPPSGRPRDVNRQAHELSKALVDLRPQLEKYNIRTLGMTQHEAQRKASADIEEIRNKAVGPTGTPTTTGEGGWLDFIPQFRETRIDTVARADPADPSKTEYVEVYVDPETGEETEPTDWQRVTEAFARQVITDPAEASKSDAVRRAERQAAFRASGGMLLNEETKALLEAEIVDEIDPIITDILTARDPKTGRVIETAFGAFLRSVPAVTTTILNQAVFDYLPVYWDQDPKTKEPLDSDDPAYRAHMFLREMYRKEGASEEDIDDALLGFGAGPGFAIPFQPIQREDPQPMDPAGRRVAETSGSFIANAATSLARGRSLGDEYMSMPGMRRGAEKNPYDLNPAYGPLADDNVIFEYNGPTAPYWVGIGTEIVYGFGPLYLPKLAGKVGGKATQAGARAVQAGARATVPATRAALTRAVGIAAADPILAKHHKAIQRAAVAAERGVRGTARGVESAARGVEKAGVIVASPVAAANRSFNIRMTHDLTEGADVAGLSDLDIRMNLNDARRVVGDNTGGEVVTPYAMAAHIEASGVGNVTAGTLKEIMGSSKSAQLVMGRSGLLNLADNHVLTSKETDDILSNINVWILSAYKPAAELDFLLPKTTDAVRAQRILDRFEEGRVDLSRVPSIGALEAIAEGNLTIPLRSAIDDVFSTIPEGALPVRAGKPVVLSMHQLGGQILDAARSTERRAPAPSVTVTGPLGRVMNRRLGDLPVNKQTLATNPQEISIAAQSAAGRAVEATLENVVPDNYVFLTRSLMAPRTSVTMALQDEVKAAMDELDFAAIRGPKIDGKVREVYLYQNPALAEKRIVDAFGSRNVERSPTLSRIVERIRGLDPINGTEQDLIIDQLLTKEYERVLGRTAKEAVFAGRQTERAAVEGVPTGMDYRPESRVPRRGIWPFLQHDIPRIISEAGGRQVGSAVRKASKALGKDVKEMPARFPKQTAYPVERLLNQLTEEVGALGDNFQREVRDTALDEMAGGATSEEAFNVVLARRLSRALDEATGSVDREVQRLMSEMGMSEDEAYFFVAYQSGAGSKLPGLGEMRRAGIPGNFGPIAKERAQVGVMERAWAQLLEEFFGPEIFEATVEPAMQRFILRPDAVLGPAVIDTPAAYRGITTADLRDVIGLIREEMPDLEKTGLARGFTRTFAEDAFFDTLAGWAMGRDVAEIELRLVRELRDQHPEIYTDLIPTARSARPARQHREASLPSINRRGLMDTLAKMSVPPDRGALQQQARFPRVAAEPIARGAGEGFGWMGYRMIGDDLEKLSRPATADDLALYARFEPDSPLSPGESISVTTVGKVADWLLKSTFDDLPTASKEVLRDQHLYSTVLERIRPHLNSDAQVFIRNNSGPLKPSGVSRGKSGPWRGATDVDAIAITGLGYETTGLHETTILHELLHSATNKQLQSLNYDVAADKAVWDGFWDIRELAKKAIEDELALPDISKARADELRHYQKTILLVGDELDPAFGDLAKAGDEFVVEASIAEFVATVFTDRGFQDLLQSIKVSRDESVLRRFVRAVAKIFKSEHDPAFVDALERVVRLSEDLLDAGDYSRISKGDAPPGAPDRGALQQQALANMQTSQAYQDMTRRAVNAQGEPIIWPSKTYKMEHTGQFINEYDNISQRMILALNAKAREDLVDTMVGQMLRRGTANVDARGYLRSLDDAVLSTTVFEKQATTNALRATIRGMDGAVAEEAAQERIRPDAILWARQFMPDVYDAIMSKAFTSKEFGQSELDVAFYNAIMDARQHYSDKYIIKTLRQGIVERSFNATVAPAIDDLVGNMRGMGFSPGMSKASLDDMVLRVKKIDPDDPSILLVGQDYAQAIAALQVAAKSGKLTENIDSLRKRDMLGQALTGKGLDKGKSAGRYAGQLLLDTLANTRRMAASGLLAGGFYVGTVRVFADEEGKSGVPIVLPAANTRYMGMNLITAPMIALTTVGAANAIRAGKGGGYASQSRDVARQISSVVGKPLVNATSQGPAEELLFTAVNGRQWTRGALQDAITRNNILATRGSVEFNDAYLKDLARDARLLADATPISESQIPFNNFLRQLDLTRTNLPQYAANATDKAFRENMFASALKEGMTEQQAANMARAVVLDYGAIPDSIKKGANRYILFLAFRAAMTNEALEALARDPGAFNRVLLNQRNMQQSGDQFLLGPDYAKSRMIVDPTEYVFDEKAGAMIYGPSIPSVEVFKDVLNLAAYVGQLGAEDNSEYLQRAAVATSEENLVPLLTLAVDSLMNKDRRPTDRGWKVPDKVVSWAVANGSDTIWPTLKNRYNIIPVTKAEELSPGRPTAFGQEWRFAEESDMQLFKRDMAIALHFGMKRTMEDWATVGLTYDVVDYLDPKRRGLPRTMGAMSGFQTPIGTPSPEETVSRALFEQQHAAESKKRMAE